MTVLLPDVVAILHEAHRHHADMAVHYMRSAAFYSFEKTRGAEHLAKAARIARVLDDAGAAPPSDDALATVGEGLALLRRAEWPHPYTI